MMDLPWTSKRWSLMRSRQDLTWICSLALDKEGKGEKETGEFRGSCRCELRGKEWDSASFHSLQLLLMVASVAQRQLGIPGGKMRTWLLLLAANWISKAVAAALRNKLPEKRVGWSVPVWRAYERAAAWVFLLGLLLSGRWDSIRSKKSYLFLRERGGSARGKL